MTWTCWHTKEFQSLPQDTAPLLFYYFPSFWKWSLHGLSSKTAASPITYACPFFVTDEITKGEVCHLFQKVISDAFESELARSVFIYVNQ